MSEVKSALKKMISSTKNLSPAVSSIAIQKLNSMRDCIGSPDWILAKNLDKVDQEFDGVLKVQIKHCKVLDI